MATGGWMVSCLTLHQIHSWTWHMASPTQEDRGMIAFPHSTLGKRGQLGGLTTGRVAIRYRQDVGTTFWVFPSTKDRWLSQHHHAGLWRTRLPPMTMRCFLADEMVPLLPVFLLFAKCCCCVHFRYDFVKDAPGDPVHIGNMSYQKWMLPEPPPSLREACSGQRAGDRALCSIRGVSLTRRWGVSNSKAPGLKF